ncbi:MAG: nucleotidyltransferase [bacterium]
MTNNMNNKDYLKVFLDSQALSDDSTELKELQKIRGEVEELLRDEFDSSPTIKYGGSKAKGTLVRESYDLDIICYFPRDDDENAETLEEVFNNVRKALETKYTVVTKTQALRLMGLSDKADFHVDVVPGRYVDDAKSDTFLYRASGDKKRLKTNLDTHIKHVRDSGVSDAIKVLKVWRTRKSLSVRTFVLELAVIELLKDHKKDSLEEQLKHVLTELRDNVDDITIKDPANPDGNDLSEAFDDNVRQILALVAKDTLTTVAASGWEGVFGALPEDSKESRVEALKRAAAGISAPTKPWCNRLV